MPATAKEKAVLSLLKLPALRYVQKVKESLDHDPHYLESHREDVGNIIIGFLAGSGFHWHRDIFDREWPDLLRQALARLGTEKRRAKGANPKP